MTTIYVTDRKGDQYQVSARAGEPLMYALRDLKHGVEAICGGMCSCATCHVYVDPEWIEKLSPRDYDEADLLDELECVKDNSRLSCQIECSAALDGIRVTIAPQE